MAFRLLPRSGRRRGARVGYAARGDVSAVACTPLKRGHWPNVPLLGQTGPAGMVGMT